MLPNSTIVATVAVVSGSVAVVSVPIAVVSGSVTDFSETRFVTKFPWTPEKSKSCLFNEIFGFSKKRYKNFFQFLFSFSLDLGEFSSYISHNSFLCFFQGKSEEFFWKVPKRFSSKSSYFFKSTLYFPANLSKKSSDLSEKSTFSYER